jgi:hypothetical protein
MVTRESATRIGVLDKFHNQLPMDTDHSGLVKFESKLDDRYLMVASRLKGLVKSTCEGMGDLRTSP